LTAAHARRIAVPLLLAYPWLALIGALQHRPAMQTAALAALLAASALLMLDRRRPLRSLSWLALALAMLAALAAGHLPLALEAVPILVNVALAWLFGHTLAAGSDPLVARIVRALEGDAHLALPGVARYARQVTQFWTALLGAQAVALTILWLCSVPDGALTALGVDSPLPLPLAWTAWYTHLGAWLLPATAMALEYAFRRGHLRHVPHLSLHDFVLRLIACWPQLLRGMLAPTSR
jgi:uncharacterized membrane protein